MKIPSRSFLVGRAVLCPPWVSRIPAPGAQGTARPALPAQRGIALVVTLILLTVITFLAVAFLFLSRRERGAVANAVELTSARLAAEAAVERAKTEVLAQVMTTSNRFNYDLLVSTNYFNPLGFQSGLAFTTVNDPRYVTNVNFFYDTGGNPLGALDLQHNLVNLFYSPRVPVFVDTNAPGIAPALRGPLDFRYYLDLNRNGRFETNGFLPVFGNNGLPLLTLDTNGNSIVLSNRLVGDPEWVGQLERSDRPHGPDNRFVSRMAFVVEPVGRTLDINTMNNQSKLLPATQDGYSRNMGFGTWELNLPALLVDLNTNAWNLNTAGILPATVNPTPYFYDSNPALSSQGTAFEDAVALLRYRYNGSWNNLRSVNQIFGPLGTSAFLTDMADGFGGGPLLTTVFSPQTDADAFYNRGNTSWPGAANPNLFLNPQDLFDGNKTTGAGQFGFNTFTNRLRATGYGASTYDRYTYYRLLSQVGTDSGPEPAKMHLNYRNMVNGEVIPNAQTNFVPWQPMDFFTNAADQLLRATFPSAADNVQLFNVNAPLSFTNIPVLVSNRVVYTPALHRVFQLAANILDSSTNYTAIRDADFPSVFRPLFERRGNDVYIRGFQEVGTVSGTGDAVFSIPLDLNDPIDRAAAGTVADQNIYGVPWVIGAKKGFPNFNEFAMQSIVDVTRKLQIRKAAVGGRPTATNQMFLVGISNVFAAEAWNSYRDNYTRGVDIIFANDMDIQLNFTNDVRFDLRGNSMRLKMAVTPAPLTILPNNWRGYGQSIRNANTNSFIIPVYTNINFLPQSVLRMTASPPNFFRSTNNLGNNYYLGYEQGLGFPIPQFTFTATNRVRFIMLDRTTRRVVDYVQLSDLNGTRDLTAELSSSNERVIASNNQSVGSESMFWNTNRATSSIGSAPLGVLNQIRASLGEIDVADWSNYGQGQANGNTKAKEIDAFRVFMGLTPVTYRNTANTNREMQAPFTPTRRTSQYVSWQANDPLVHFMAGDLQNLAEADSLRREQPSGPIQPIPNIGRLNKRFEPWGGYPGVEATAQASRIPAYGLMAKDPGVRIPDDWDFPTNKYPTLGWLGRVHRGTPWQTIYMKSPGVDNTAWSRWTGDNNGLDSNYSKPINDRVVFDVFTTAFNEDATRGQLNVNQDGLAAWSAGLSGLIGLTNVTDDQDLLVGMTATNAPFIISPAGVEGGEVTNTVLGRIWSGINRTRAAAPFNGTFKSTGDILLTPELSVASPLLNTNSTAQLQRGISDAAYERIPQMLMGLLRGDDQPRFAIYAYGQALKPANRSIITSGQLSGMCTNYQVTAEFATRTVVRIEGAPESPRAVVESYNVLPPE